MRACAAPLYRLWRPLGLEVSVEFLLCVMSSDCPMQMAPSSFTSMSLESWWLFSPIKGFYQNSWALQFVFQNPRHPVSSDSHFALVKLDEKHLPLPGFLCVWATEVFVGVQLSRHIPRTLLGRSCSGGGVSHCAVPSRPPPTEGKDSLLATCLSVLKLRGEFFFCRAFSWFLLLWLLRFEGRKESLWELGRAEFLADLQSTGLDIQWSCPLTVLPDTEQVDASVPRLRSRDNDSYNLIGGLCQSGKWCIRR